MAGLAVSRAREGVLRWSLLERGDVSACPGASRRRYVCGEDLMACLWRLHPALEELLGLRRGMVFCEAEDVRILVCFLYRFACCMERDSHTWRLLLNIDFQVRGSLRMARSRQMMQYCVVRGRKIVVTVTRRVMQACGDSSLCSSAVGVAMWNVLELKYYLYVRVWFACCN